MTDYEVFQQYKRRMHEMIEQCAEIERDKRERSKAVKPPAVVPDDQVTAMDSCMGGLT